MSHVSDLSPLIEGALFDDLKRTFADMSDEDLIASLTSRAKRVIASGARVVTLSEAREMFFGDCWEIVRKELANRIRRHLHAGNIQMPRVKFDEGVMHIASSKFPNAYGAPHTVNIKNCRVFAAGTPRDKIVESLASEAQDAHYSNLDICFRLAKGGVEIIPAPVHEISWASCIFAADRTVVDSDMVTFKIAPIDQETGAIGQFDKFRLLHIALGGTVLIMKHATSNKFELVC